MSMPTTTLAVGRANEAQLPPPLPKRSVLHLLFGSVLSSAFTLLCFWAIVALLPRAMNWAILDAVWSAADGTNCRGQGACWAFLAAKSRLILFGLYPPEEQWRPQSVIGIFIVMGIVSIAPRHWGKRLMAAWAIAFVLIILLMAGGAFGLTRVPTDAWGGLPVTLLLATLSLVFAFPLAIALAVGRRSNLPVARYVSVGMIEIIRGTPLLSLLFVASILMPMFLPEGWTPDKLTRALAALTIFSAAYLAEVVRGGLQDVPNGQIEAARALGVSWSATMRRIIIPQALRKVIPPLTNTLIVMIKNTSLVFVVGLFDLLSSARAALTDPAWPTPFTETYIFIGLIYFAICFSISLYSSWLEEYLATRRSR